MESKTIVLSPNRKIQSIKPVVYLAGPSCNTSNWSGGAIKFFLKKNTDCIVACPGTSYLCPELYISGKENKFQNNFSSHTDWTNFYMEKAGYGGGVILFWLPAEQSPKKYPGKHFAHITQFELGRWVTEARLNPHVRIVIGTDEKYPEIETVLSLIKRQGCSNIHFFHTLKECCHKAAELVEPKNYPVLVEGYHHPGWVEKKISLEKFKEIFLTKRPKYILGRSSKFPAFEILEIYQDGLKIKSSLVDEEEKYSSFYEFYTFELVNDFYQYRLVGRLEEKILKRRVG